MKEKMKLKRKTNKCLLVLGTISILKYYIFEPNNIKTRKKIVKDVEKFLSILLPENLCSVYAQNNLVDNVDDNEFVLTITIGYGNSYNFAIKSNRKIICERYL